MRIAVYHSFHPAERKLGGELSTYYQYRKGIELGHEMTWVDRRGKVWIDDEPFDRGEKFKTLPRRSDLYVLGEWTSYSAELLQRIRSDAAPKIHIVHNSLPVVSHLPLPDNFDVAVWIAPDQREHNPQIQARHHIVNSCYVDHRQFFDLGLERQPAQVYVGEIAPHKVTPVMIDEIRENPAQQYHFYGHSRNHSDFVSDLGSLPNVTIGPEIAQDRLNAVYNSYETFFWKLDRYGSFGRANVEAMLAGCELNVNRERFGLFRFDVDWTSRQAIVDWLERDLERFWPEILNRLS